MVDQSTNKVGVSSVVREFEKTVKEGILPLRVTKSRLRSVSTKIRQGRPLLLSLTLFFTDLYTIDVFFKGLGPPCKEYFTPLVTPTRTERRVRSKHPTDRQGNKGPHRSQTLMEDPPRHFMSWVTLHPCRHPD